MCIEYRVGLGGNIWKNRRKITISWHFRGLVLVPNSVVPVPSVLIDWYRYRKVGTGTQCFVLDQR